MNVARDARLSRKVTAAAARSATILGLSLGLLVGTGAQVASAHQDPPGCSGTGVDFRFDAFRSDGTVLDGSFPSECETITYQIKVGKSNIGTPCAFEGGTMTIKTPDGVVHNVTPGAGVPCIGGTGTCTAVVSASNVVNYTVNPADVIAGLIIATGDYKAALSHTGPGASDSPNVPHANSSMVNTVAFCPSDTPCVDNFCNPDLFDSTTGALGNCDFTNVPDSTPCPDTDSNLCTTAGCNGAGSCDQNHIVTPCPPDNKACSQDPACNPETGQCEHPPKPNSTPCPDTDGNLCTTAGCNGTLNSSPAGGIIDGCDQNHIVTVCPPDGNPCTDDAGCNPQNGQCQYPNTPNSTPCPDTDGQSCTTAGCNGSGVCDQLHINQCTTTSTTVTVTTSTTSTTVCVPTGPETGMCSDMIDNDCDGLVDCDDPDCPHVCQGGTADGQECSTSGGATACAAGGGTCRCPPIQKDPTTIKFGPAGANLDQLKSHGRVTITGPVDVPNSEVGWLLSNARGGIYGVSLPAGVMTANQKGTSFKYKNKAAKTQGGVALAGVKITHHGQSYGYRVEAYGNMALATDAQMSIQFYVGNQDTSAIHSEVWQRLRNGWKAHGFE